MKRIISLLLTVFMFFHCGLLYAQQTLNYVSKFATPPNIINSSIFDNGNVGINTATIGGSKFQVNGSVAIGYNASTTAPTNGLCVSGNVGIGLTNPTATFQTLTTGLKFTTSTGALLSNTATSNSASIVKSGLQIASTGSWIGANSKNIGIYVSTVSGGTKNYDAIFAGSGVVGIGLTTPQAPLHLHSLNLKDDGGGGGGNGPLNMVGYTVFQITNSTTGSSVDVGMEMMQFGNTSSIKALSGPLTLSSTENFIISGVGTSNINCSNTLNLNAISGFNMISTGGSFDSRALSFYLWSPSGAIFKMLPTGNVGIGTVNPTQKLEIVHNDATGGIILNRVNGGTSSKSEIKFAKNGVGKWSLGCDFDMNDNQTFFLWDNVASSARLIINQHGQMGVGGVIPPANDLFYKLFVDGGIAARDVKVTALTFPDFVFSDTYKLLTLAEVEEYIKLNKHLPDVLSADDAITNGVSLGEMNITLLQKIEELTLYMIDMKKENDKLKERISTLENK